MRYRLIAADMDGTLLNDQSVITERTKTAVLRAVEAGALFVAATGRPMRGVENVNALFGRDMPFITFNGAVVIMGKSKKVLFSKTLDGPYVREIYTLGTEQNVPVALWIGERLWVSRVCEATIGYQKISDAEMVVIGDIDSLKNAGVIKMLWIDTPERVKRLQSEMNAHFRGRVNCHISRPSFLEFVSAGADKAIAMGEIGKAYGIDRGEMIAVGDSYNDISMLKYAGLGVAMGNAPDDIKAICRHVTCSNNEDGVAAVIDKYILGKDYDE